MPGLKLTQILTAMAAPRARVPQRKASIRQTVAALLGLLIGYPLFAFAGYWITQLFAGASFDRSMEASMIAVFAIGPVGGVVGLMAGMVVGGKRRAPKTPSLAEDI